MKSDHRAAMWHSASRNADDAFAQSVHVYHKASMRPLGWSRDGPGVGLSFRTLLRSTKCGVVGNPRGNAGHWLQWQKKQIVRLSQKSAKYSLLQSLSRAKCVLRPRQQSARYMDTNTCHGFPSNNNTAYCVSIVIKIHQKSAKTWQ